MEDSTHSEPAGPVVVGVDGSGPAREAAAWAAGLARARGVPLHLVHLAPAAAPGWLDELAADLGAAVELVAAVAGPDEVAAELRARADGAGLLVVGGHGAGSSSGLLAGTVAARLAGGVPCPLAVVHGAGPELPVPAEGPVVVGVEGSQARLGAVDLAAGLAVDLGAPLLLVHAWSDVVAGPGGGAHRQPADWSELAARGEAVAAQARRRVADRHPGVEVEARSVEGTALRVLLDLAATARMVVVAPRAASRAPGPGDGMLLGSTSRGLVGFAPCPVVLAAARVPAAR